MNLKKLKKLKTELNNLEQRLDNLSIFFVSDAYKKLPLYEKELLNRQAEGMRVYLYFLQKRFNLYNRQREAIKNAENND